MKHLEELRRRAKELADEETDEAVEINREILATDPTDEVTVSRLGIVLINRNEFSQARDVLERGPRNGIGERRLKEVNETLDRLAREVPPRTPEEIVERVLCGPGRDACIRFFASSIREIQQLDGSLLAVTDIPSENRFRVVGGIHSACSVYQGMLDVSIDVRMSDDLVEGVKAAGGRITEDRRPLGAVPFTIQISVPPTAVDQLWHPLWEAHRAHLVESIDYGRPPTHQHEDRSDLRDYLLAQADALVEEGGAA